MLKIPDGKSILRKRHGRTFSVAIAGDTCPRDAGIEAVRNGQSADILKEIQPCLDSADLRLVQWENPLTDADTPIDKSGPNIACLPDCVEFALAGNFDVALLANNHVGDYGDQAVLETIDIMRKKGIKTVGAGKDLADASKVLRIEQNGFTVAIINVAESEFGIALKDKPGFAPLDLINNLRTIEQMSAECDIVLIIVHGGNEELPIPSPRMVKTYRAFADAGASAVINIHTHCPQGIEIYHEVPIIYCPGNFFFPSALRKYTPEDFWWSGYLPVVTFDRQGAVELQITPYTFTDNPCKMKVINGMEKEKFYFYLEHISALIEQTEEYFAAWCAMLGPVQVESIKIRMTELDNIRNYLFLRNLFSCEAHNELMTVFFRMSDDDSFERSKKLIPQLKKLQKATFWNPKKGD